MFQTLYWPSQDTTHSRISSTLYIGYSIVYTNHASLTRTR